MIVPAVVPSLFHNSMPVSPSSALKNRVPPNSVSQLAQISLTRTVPASVPSLFHSSRPFVPSLAEKNSVAPTAVSQRGLDPMPKVALMFLTITVPASVAVAFSIARSHLFPSLAWKNSVPSTFVSLSKPEAPIRLMSFTMAVPPAVPHHSSTAPSH